MVRAINITTFSGNGFRCHIFLHAMYNYLIVCQLKKKLLNNIVYKYTFYNENTQFLFESLWFRIIYVNPKHANYPLQITNVDISNMSITLLAGLDCPTEQVHPRNP